MTTTAERLRSYWGERQVDRARITLLIARYWEVALFAAIVGLALGLRLWDLGGRAIHHDESIHMQFSWYLSEGRGYTHDPVYHGPLKYIVTAAIFKMPWFGDTDATARLLPALAGTALVALPYFLRGYLGRTGALIASFLLAVSPVLLYVSRFQRDDILISAYTLGLVIVIWRYLKEQKEAYLFAIPLLLMLGFTTMEMAFITTAIFLVYLDILLTQDLVDQIRASRPMTATDRVVAYAVLLPTAWLVAALWPLIEGPRKRWSLNELPPSGHLVVIMGTFALPQFSAAIQKVPEFLEKVPAIGDGLVSGLRLDDALGNQGNFAEPDLMRATVLLTLVASAYIGLLWNARVWAIGAAIFYIPFFLLFTTFFSNGGDLWNVYSIVTPQCGGFGHACGEFWRGEGGFWTGSWGALDYWLEQQFVRRGDQPDYYYFMLLPVYEFLPLIFAVGGVLYFAFQAKLEQRLLALSALLLILTFTVFIFLPVYALLPALAGFAVLFALVCYLSGGKLEHLLLCASVLLISLSLSFSDGVIDDSKVQLSFLVAIGAVLLLPLEGFTKFVLFWALSVFFGITVAGEKMPWLTVHVALPVVILAALVLDRILANVVLPAKAPEPPPEPEPPRTRRRRRAAEPPPPAAIELTFEQLAPVALLVAGGALALVAAVFFIALGPGTPASVFPWLFSAGALLVVLWAARVVSWRTAGQVAAVSLFAAMLVFTLQASGRAAFDEGDPGGVPPELLIYAQGAPDLDVIMDEIDRVAEASGRGKDLRIVLDDTEGTNIWPWPWYLRHYRNVGYEKFTGDFVPEPGSVLLVSTGNKEKINAYLAQVDHSEDYRHMWWFPPDRYRNLTVTGFLKDFFQGDYLSTWRLYFSERKLVNAVEGDDRTAFFFREFAQGEVGPAVALDPAVMSTIGAPGAEPGQFSQPADVTLDADGNLYVVDTLNRRVQRISPSGEAEVLGEAGSGEGQFGAVDPPDGPWGIGIDQQGNIYVADTWNHRIQKFGPDLSFITTWGVQVSSENYAAGTPGPLELFGPRDVAIDADGNVLVVDTGNKRIVKYSPDGQFIQAYGSSGTGQGQFDEPSSIAIAPVTGDIYVADYWNRRIQHFNPQFSFVEEIAVNGWGSHGITDRAYMVVTGDGKIVATDPGTGRILVIDPAAGTQTPWKLREDTTTTRPVGIALDGQGQVYIGDSAAGEVRRVPLSALLAPQPTPAASATPTASPTPAP